MPEFGAFADKITGLIWDLRGTSSVRHLRFDGETVHNLTAENRRGSNYEFSFVDVGVIRLNFK